MEVRGQPIIIWGCGAKRNQKSLDAAQKINSFKGLPKKKKKKNSIKFSSI